jgi:hypothetical protein
MMRWFVSFAIDRCHSNSVAIVAIIHCYQSNARTCVWPSLTTACTNFRYTHF